VVTAIGGRRCPALSIAPAASVWRSVLWSGIFCLGFPELGAQLVEVMCGDHLHERAVACDLIRPAPGTGHGLHGARRVTAHCADLSHARGVDQPRCASAA
jgi:hypothetical protein